MRALWRERQLRLADLLRMVIAALRAPRPLAAETLRSNKAYLKDKAVRELQEIALLCLAREILPAISREAIETIEQHKRRRHMVVLLTGSLDLLINPLADRLGVDAAIATRLEQQNGSYTGHLSPPHPYGEGKRVLLERFAREHRISLSHSYLYGDSHADLAALHAVGHPRVVNPHARMARIARERGWRILHW